MNEKQWTRRGVLTAFGTAAIATMPAVASNGTNGGHEAVTTRRVGGGLPDGVQRYTGSDLPGAVVSVDADDDSALDALDSWADHDERHLITTREGTGTVTVAAPLEHLVAMPWTFRGPTPLADENFVERISLDVRFETPDPVRLQPEADVELSSPLWLSDPNTSTVAFEDDVEATTLADVRDAVGVDDIDETGAGETIAIVDDGVTPDEDLYGGRIVAQQSFVGGADADDDADSDSDEAVESDGGHGDWVASAAVADPEDTEFQGIAPDAELIIAKALSNTSGSTGDIAEAIRWSADEGATVINLSLGAPLDSPEVRAAIIDAVDEGLVVVAATGNSRQTRRFVDAPASSTSQVDGLIAVNAGTTDSADSIKPSYFGSVGPQNSVADASGGATFGAMPDLIAPGMEIEAAMPSGTETLSGTSMAAPIVSGIVALTAEASGDTDEALAERITEAGQNAPNVGLTEGEYGLVDAERAVDGADADDRDLDSEAAQRDAVHDAFGGALARRALAVQERFAG